MKLAVVGSRSITDKDFVFEVLDQLVGIKEIVSGGARGVDTIAAEYAQKRKLKCVVFKPDWESFPRSAGMIRNKDIVNYADAVVAFWDGKSPGTKCSIDYAKKQGKLLKIAR